MGPSRGLRIIPQFRREWEQRGDRGPHLGSYPSCGGPSSGRLWLPSLLPQLIPDLRRMETCKDPAGRLSYRTQSLRRAVPSAWHATSGMSGPPERLCLRWVFIRHGASGFQGLRIRSLEGFGLRPRPGPLRAGPRLDERGRDALERACQYSWDFALSKGVGVRSQRSGSISLTAEYKSDGVTMRSLTPLAGPSYGSTAVQQYGYNSIPWLPGWFGSDSVQGCNA
jgi:hypothetical protein